MKTDPRASTATKPSTPTGLSKPVSPPSSGSAAVANPNAANASATDKDKTDKSKSGSPAQKAAAKSPAPQSATARLVSLDAYRGFVMLAMASGGLAIAAVLKNNPDLHISEFWKFLGYQLDHVYWVGGGFWDMIQPSFMFIVGVAMPFSMAARRSRGDSRLKIYSHGLLRALILVFLGVFLYSQNRIFPNGSFVNVLAQIGLGYFFALLLVELGWIAQIAAVLVILGGYWTYFNTTPAPPDDFDYKSVDFFVYREGFVQNPGQPAFEPLKGNFAHWNPGTNAAAKFDLWLNDYLPRTEMKLGDKEPPKSNGLYNSGGYQNLNFIPSLATILFGLMAGRWLQSNRMPSRKLLGLFVAGAAFIGVGWLLGEYVCPLVKRIWTPSWAVYSTGWCLLLLALFYAVIDVAGWKRWAFPLVVVGMNSIAIYMMASLWSGWIKSGLRTWGNLALPSMKAQGINVGHVFEYRYGPMIEAALVVMIVWLVCFLDVPAEGFYKDLNRMV